VTAPALKIVTQTESWKKEIDENIIKILEDHLAKAKAGEFDGLAVIFSTKDNMCGHAYSNMMSRNDIIGVCERLKHAILTSMDNER
jgi:hypothetical protein